MADPAILFVKPGAVKASDKARLSKAGVVVVEMEDPTSTRLVSAEPPFRELSTGALLAAFAKAIASDSAGYVKQALAKAVSEAIILEHGKQ